MGLLFEHLTETTRSAMLSEIDIDVAADMLYLSNYLNEIGCDRWLTFLKEAAKIGTDDSLAEALLKEACFKTKVERRKPKGGFTMVAVPVTASQTLAEAQFNMYYMRALAVQALEPVKASSFIERSRSRYRELNLRK